MFYHERADDGRWTLPGGWADVNLTGAENVAKEIMEESGFIVRVTKLAGVWDRSRHGHTPKPFHAYKLFFICDVTGGAARILIGASTTPTVNYATNPGDLYVQNNLEIDGNVYLGDVITDSPDFPAGKGFRWD